MCCGNLSVTVDDRKYDFQENALQSGGSIDFDKEKPEINVVKKETTKFKLHEESISKIFYLEGKRIPFTHQETLANCGPLSITNGISALKGINNEFKLFGDDKKFPETSHEIRKLLSSDPNLKTTIWGTASSTEIEKDNYRLEMKQIANLIKRLETESNIKITGDRFSGTVPVFGINEKLNDSD